MASESVITIIIARGQALSVCLLLDGLVGPFESKILFIRLR